MTVSTKIDDFIIRKAEKADVALVLDFIKKLAVYERLSHEVVATEEQLVKYLFSEERVAEVVIGYYQDIPVGFALYFYNFSTFLGKPGIYLGISLFLRSKGGKVLGRHCLHTWLSLPWRRIVAGSNGQCWIGTNPPLSFINLWEPK